jgi:site-specific DNA-methyltransferase (adenine-specific)
VLDPFVGSGSSLVAAAISGRRAIGVELQPRWFDVACDRVEAALKSRQGVLL